MRFSVLFILLAIMGCTQFPELDSALSPRAQNADFPTLVPVHTLLAQSATISAPPEQTVDTLNARVAALNNRAARLRGPVVDANSKKRLQDSVK